LSWTTSSSLDSTQQAVLEQKCAEGLVLVSWPIKRPDGDLVLSIVSSDPPAVRDALNLRRDQKVSVEPSPVLTASVAWLEPELLELYQATPLGLLELDVWISPAAAR
jgi:hypothetical protein